MSQSFDSDESDAPAQKKDEGIETELDECILVDWSEPKEKYKFQYYSPRSNAFVVTIKSTDSHCIPVKFTLERAKSPQTFRLFASITNNFTNDVVSKYVDTVLSAAVSSATVKLPIKPFDIIEDGWTIEDNLCVVIKIFRLKKGIKIAPKEQKERKRKSKHEDSDGEFQVTEIEKFSTSSMGITSRAQDIKSQKQFRMNNFLESQILLGEDGIAAPYCGLLNLGATCYMNSFLQVLYHIPYFRKLIYSINTTNEDHRTSIVFNLQRLFALMEMSPYAVSTEELTVSFGWNEADTNVQHDIEEFSRVLMDAIKSKLEGTPEAAEIQKMFCGEQIHHIEFPKVKKSLSNTEAFEDLQLLVKECPDIYKSFQHYISPQKIDEYKTDEWGKQKAMISTLFTHLPDVLILHLQRFEFDPNSLSMTKINTRYQFMTEIDMKDFMDEASNESTEFTLTGVIVHSGNPIGGHYYSYLKTKNDSQWYLFNDSSVRTATEEKAVSTNYGGQGSIDDGPFFGKPKTYSAYMLVYVRTTELARIFAPITSQCIPSNIVDVVREFRRREEERIALETTVKFSLYTEECISRSVCEYVEPLSSFTFSPVTVTLNTSDLVTDLYNKVAEILKADVKNVILWYLAKDIFVGQVPNNETPIKAMPTSHIFAQKLQPNFPRSIHIFFLIYYDRKSPKRPFKYITYMMPSQLKEKLGEALQRHLSAVQVNFTSPPTCYGFRNDRNILSKLDLAMSFKTLHLKHCSYIFLQPSDKKEATFPEGLPLVPQFEDEGYEYFYDVFPEEMPLTPEQMFADMSLEYKFHLVSNTGNKVLGKGIVPSSISFDQLRQFLCQISGMIYDDQTQICFLYRENDIKPIQESRLALNKSFIFKPSPTVNNVSVLIVEKSDNQKTDKCLRLITYFSEDSVHVGEPDVQIHDFDETISDLIDFNKKKNEVADDRKVRACGINNGKIGKLYNLKENLRELENPVRLEIVPEYQMNIAQSDFFIRVSSLGPEGSDYFSDPFYFLVKPKETFDAAKERIKEITKIPDEVFKTLAFKMKTRSDYGTTTLEDSMELWKLMSAYDRLFIVFPGASDFPVKRRAIVVNQSLKINH
ncbi:Clan CA, family C19, ubiquitin hydrolase-like cysteine peptidase [Trichomonas vaginalis G3]|uniref:ubiquitinyl hydrolase 1 n=1 Tax=Trichomonas vaginalis (strain ATCC PRA-98 / G3) TaxID=412133 RepID=A2E5X4_TRIV3|nr:ubiquitinyl hydrolase protein [Trichomonas vaginalis G3]EAY11931.1 Clan CA, family C19, ubiquitin hydrolase-like cysteine peptidase [Trichomonas vaginalis G3]KAI5530404.1 ubiquitinyl hydrolase protein [Trichomonas vaginalis G3]|eukprot:XP_001324154.1 Clan CA, family C19, ubiquitin hydrolase-like cysteine peptidase [Trichomonas vaginalis G3]